MYNTLYMKEKLRKMLIESNKSNLPSLIPRNLVRNPDKKKIIAISGVRGAGKTFVCFEMIGDLLKSGLPRENITYLNFEDERLGPFGGNVLASLLELQTELFVRDCSKPRYCFLDEVCRVPDWTSWVENTIDQNPDLTIVVAGSALKVAVPAILEKSVPVTVHPYSFREYLNARGFKMEFSWNLLFSEQRNIIKRYFNEYFHRGGFPGIADSDSHLKALQQNYRTLFCRDMVEPNTVQNIRQFDDFIKIQMACFASFSSISTIEKEMRKLGYSLSKNTLMYYLGYVFDASLMFETDRLNAAPESRARYPRKLYAVDHGLLQAVRFSQPDDTERILRNIVYMELRRRHGPVGYHGGKNECDFIIRTNNVVSECLQVCAGVENSDDAERKVQNLCAVLDLYKLDSGIVITNDEHANMERYGKTIFVRPAWFFAIEQVE